MRRTSWSLQLEQSSTGNSQHSAPHIISTRAIHCCCEHYITIQGTHRQKYLTRSKTKQNVLRRDNFSRLYCFLVAHIIPWFLSFRFYLPIKFKALCWKKKTCFLHTSAANTMGPTEYVPFPAIQRRRRSHSLKRSTHLIQTVDNSRRKWSRNDTESLSQTTRTKNYPTKINIV